MDIRLCIPQNGGNSVHSRIYRKEKCIDMVYLIINIDHVKKRYFLQIDCESQEERQKIHNLLNQKQAMEKKRVSQVLLGILENANKTDVR